MLWWSSSLYHILLPFWAQDPLSRRRTCWPSSSETTPGSAKEISAAIGRSCSLWPGCVCLLTELSPQDDAVSLAKWCLTMMRDCQIFSMEIPLGDDIIQVQRTGAPSACSCVHPCSGAGASLQAGRISISSFVCAGVTCSLTIRKALVMAGLPSILSGKSLRGSGFWKCLYGLHDICLTCMTSADWTTADAAVPAQVVLLEDTFDPDGRMQAAHALRRLAKDVKLREPVAGTPSCL